MSKGGEELPSIFLFVLLLMCVLLIWAVSGIILYNLYDSTARGTFGDMFGAVNALFSGLAFAALIFTLMLQRKELALQRKELSLTRKELQGQREQMEAQNETFKLQRFENTFFELLKVHGQIVEAIDLIDSRGRITKGRDCVRAFYGRLGGEFSLDPDPDRERLLEGAKAAYMAFYNHYQSEFGHYFRHLYHIIKFVMQSDIPDKKRYTNFVRAQLSTYELALLFYNGLSDHGVEKFKPLIEEFALLKNLPPSVLLHKEHVALYSQEAFGRSSTVSA